MKLNPDTWCQVDLKRKNPSEQFQWMMLTRLENLMDGLGKLILHARRVTRSEGGGGCDGRDGNSVQPLPTTCVALIKCNKAGEHLKHPSWGYVSSLVV